MPELNETLEVLNKRLVDFFGKFEDGSPNWRIVWSDDLIEKRLVYETPEGFILTNPILKEVLKYNYIKERFILERQIPVPLSDSVELVDKTSYEPLWVFEDDNHEYLPPDWDVTKLIIETVLDQTTKHHYTITNPEGNTTEELEEKAKIFEKAIFGNETKIGDALKVGEAVGYGTYRRNDTRFNNNKIKDFN